MKKLLGELDIFVGSDEEFFTMGIIWPKWDATQDKAYHVEARLNFLNKKLYKIDDFFKFNKVDGHKNLVE